MKIISKFLILVLVIGMMSGCGNGAEAPIKGEAGNIEQPSVSDQGNKSFSSIEDISDLVDDAVDLMGGKTEDVRILQFQCKV